MTYYTLSPVEEDALRKFAWCYRGWLSRRTVLQPEIARYEAHPRMQRTDVTPGARRVLRLRRGRRIAACLPRSPGCLRSGRAGGAFRRASGVGRGCRAAASRHRRSIAGDTATRATPNT